MDFEIIIRNASLQEAKELFAAIPPRCSIKVTQQDLPGPEPQEVPVETVHARIVEQPHKSKKQIPFSYRTEKRQYQNAWNLCRKWNLPYPEAKLKEAGMHLEIVPSPVTKETVKPIPATGPAPVTMDTIPKSESVVGWKVRQIKADRGAQARGILMVTARKNGSGLIECKYEGKRQIIDATCLEVVERLPISA